MAAAIRNSFDFSTPGTARRVNTLTLFESIYHVTSTAYVEGGLSAGSEQTLPTLQISGVRNPLKLSWPTNASEFGLESSPSIGALLIWSPVTNALVPEGRFLTVNVSPSNQARYYRLKR